MFSDYFSYFKNYTPKISIVLRFSFFLKDNDKSINIRNDLKFDEVIVENLKETENAIDTDTYIDEKGGFIKGEKNKKNIIGMAMSVGDVNKIWQNDKD